MPKGSEKPYNRAEKMIVEGMKKARKSGAGTRQHRVPGAEGSTSGVGTFRVNPSKRQEQRATRERQSYVEEAKEAQEARKRKGSK